MNRAAYLANLSRLTYSAPAGDDGSDGGGGTDQGAGDTSTDKGAGEGGSDTGDKGSGDDKGGDDKEGDKPGMSDSEAKLLKEVMKNKDRAKDSEAKLAESTKQMAALTEALGGKSLEDIAALIKGQKDKATSDLEKKGEYDRIVLAMAEENKTLLGGKDLTITEQLEKIAGLSKTINKLTVGRAFGDSAFIKDEMTLPLSVARNEFISYFDSVEGETVGFDKPRGSSDRTPLVDSQGAGLSFDDAMKKLVKAHPDSASLIKSKMKPGAGSGSTEKPGQKASKPKVSGMSRIAQGLNSKK